MSKDGMDFVSIVGNVFKGEPMPEGGRSHQDLPGWRAELDHSLVSATGLGLEESAK